MPNAKRGRPTTIDAVQVVELRQNPERWTWAQIAEKMGIAESSAIRVFSKYRQAGAGDSATAGDPATGSPVDVPAPSTPDV